MLRKLLSIVIATIIVVACDDNIATSGSVQPIASTDSLHLGTMLSGNASPTYLLKLYNRHDKELKLTSISLRGAGESGFRMNVDGMNGATFTQSELLRIASGDSLFIFVEATFPEDRTGICIDYIDVICNGRTQTVVLDAVCRPIEKLKAYHVVSNETWDNAREVQIFDSLVVENGVTLTLTDSTTLYLHDKTNIIVYGNLIAEGSVDRPVTIRGDRTDWMFTTLPYDNLPSQWGSMRLKAGSRGCFKHTDIRGMDEGIFIESEATFNCCRIKNSNGNLIGCRNATVEICNSELLNARLSLLEAVGGTYEIIHSTLANFHFAAVVAQDVLHLTNHDTLTQMPAPLYKCDFVNSIVWGKSYAPHISLDYVAPAEGDSIFAYKFDHCLLSEDGNDDENFISILWNESPMFKIEDVASYLYDQHLQEGSPCIAAGNPEVVSRVPLDLEGKTRPETPSIGCYEY